MSIDVGNVIEGTVTGITDFGAFVELTKGETGLVHISEVADTYVKDINKFLEVGEEVTVKIISVDEEGKIGLSIRQLDDDQKKDKFKKINKKSLDEMIDDFMQESNQRQQDLKNNLEAKGGGQ